MGRRRVQRKGKARSRPPRGDAIWMKGSEILFNIAQVAANTGPIQYQGTNSYSFDVRPATLSDRVQIAGSIYSRYRIKRLKLIYKSTVPSTTNGALAIGVLDDANVSNSVGHINNYDTVVNLRRSNDNNLWRNFIVTWRPLDPLKWYYTDSSGSDNRFSSPCSIFASFDSTPGANSVFGSVRLEYLVEFEGATPQVVPSLKRFRLSRVKDDALMSVASEQVDEVEGNKDESDCSVRIDQSKVCAGSGDDNLTVRCHCRRSSVGNVKFASINLDDVSSVDIHT